MTDDTKQPLSTKAKALIGAALAVLFIGGFWSTATGDDETPAPEAETVSFGEGDAWLNCQDAVKGQLANPATADFSMLSSDITEEDSGWFNINGSLTAENDLGVEQEVAFTCRVHEGEPVEAEVAQAN